MTGTHDSFEPAPKKTTSGQGRKTFAFWTLVCLLLFLALGNLILTVTILGVLRLGYGLDSLELVPEASALKFFGNADLGHVYKVDGRLNGFENVPVAIQSSNGSLLLNVIKRAGRPVNKLRMNRFGTVINHTDAFLVRNARNQAVFSTQNPAFRLLNGADQLTTLAAHTNRFVALSNKTVEFRSDGSMNLKGNEGTRMDSKEIVWSADQNVYFSAANGSIVLKGDQGLVVDLKRIPIVSNTKPGAMVAQFKLCVCYPHGKLFKIPVVLGQFSKVNCNHIKMTPNYNPCM